MSILPPSQKVLAQETDGAAEDQPFQSLRGSADRWKTTAALLRSKGDARGAASAYAEAVACDPGDAETSRELGMALIEAGDRHAAIAAFHNAIRLRPEAADLYVNLGVLLFDEGSFQEAIKCQTHALDLDPTMAEAFNNLGIALRASGRLVEAREVLQRAVGLYPLFGPAHYNLGCVLFDRWELDAAEATFRIATELLPTSPAAWTNLGHTLYRKENNDAAIACYQTALKIQPDFVDAHWNLSHALLLRGDLARGWAEFEWRWRKSEFRTLRRVYGCPDWDGRDISGRTLLVFAEQGFGDLFQFARYISLLVERRTKIVVEAPAEAVDLMRDISGVEAVVTRGHILPPVDFCCGLLSLPYLLSRQGVIDVPAAPYLCSPHSRRSMWGERIRGLEHAFRVGIAWSGSQTNLAGKYRSMRLEDILPLFEMPGIQFFSLQRGDAANDLQMSGSMAHVIDWSCDLHDFSDTAALIQQLDLVISIDTAVAHLAGALGQPVWSLLPRVPDWRWPGQRNDTPWYPTMRLYRQTELGNWSGPVGRVTLDLATMATRAIQRSQ